MPIPKKIHFYWGNETMSWMRYMTLKSFRMLNPDWEVILYQSLCGGTGKTWGTDNFQDFFCFEGRDYFESIKELDIIVKTWDLSDNKINILENNAEMGASHKSNFFKWSLMATDGGFYSDLDILYFRPIDDFYNKLEGYTTVICQDKYLSIGLLASAGNDDFFKDIFLNCINCYTPHEYQSAGVQNIYEVYNKISPDCTQDEVLELAKVRYPHLKFYNIPMDLVYPFDSTKVIPAFKNEINIEDIPPETIGYHWYAGHKVAQDFNNILNGGNFMESETLFAKIVKKYL